jgi:phosphatidylglycerophosphatase A
MSERPTLSLSPRRAERGISAFVVRGQQKVSERNRLVAIRGDPRTAGRLCAGFGAGLGDGDQEAKVIRTGKRSRPQFWQPARLIATWFGVGLSPVAPGTCASLAALPIAWAIRAAAGRAGLAAGAALVFAAGCWAAGAAAKASGVRDPAAVVVDEVAGQWLVVLAAPFDPAAWAAGFVLFRLFDIWKPWPVRWADRQVKGGFGIMLDDILAAGYAVVVLEGLRATGGAAGVRL